MDLLFEYKQTKKNNRTNSLVTCFISILSDETSLYMKNKFIFNQPKGTIGSIGETVIEHRLTLDYKRGDFITYYDVVFINQGGDNINEENIKILKNNFKSLYELTDSGYYFGERPIYPGWGVKYNSHMIIGFDIMKKHLQNKIKTKFLKEKDYKFPSVNSFFDLIVDYHLDVNGIKGHNNIYKDIINVYPQKKYLKLNDMKFIPAILDQNGIKTSHYISELNNDEERDGIKIKTLKYLCDLFGNEHINYLNKFNWVTFCTYKITSNNTHKLKTDNERKSLLSLLSEIDEQHITKQDNIIQSIFNVMSFREFIEKRGIQLKFNSKTTNEFKLLNQEWGILKKQFRRGYSISYVFPQEFLDVVSESIIVDDVVYVVKILKSEDEFVFEGETMKNCIGKMFTHGAAFIYISIIGDDKRVNLQYSNGKLSSSYGKANSEVPEEFIEPIAILSKKMKEFPDLKWEKQKTMLS